MQMTITINHTFDDVDLLVQFAQRMKALFADLLVPAVSAQETPPVVIANPVAGSFGGGNGAVAAPIVPVPVEAAPTSNVVPLVEAQTPAKRGRGRPRVNKDADVAPAPAAADLCVGLFDAPSPPRVSAATMEDVRAAISDLLVKGAPGEKVFSDWMLRNGYARSKDIKPERAEAHARELRELLARLP